jgi:hypothetical protein
VPAAKWSINKSASRRAQPAVAGRGLSEGLGRTREAATEFRLENTFWRRLLAAEVYKCSQKPAVEPQV